MAVSVLTSRSDSSTFDHQKVQEPCSSRANLFSPKPIAQWGFEKSLSVVEPIVVVASLSPDGQLAAVGNGIIIAESISVQPIVLTCAHLMPENEKVICGVFSYSCMDRSSGVGSVEYCEYAATMLATDRSEDLALVEVTTTRRIRSIWDVENNVELPMAMTVLSIVPFGEPRMKTSDFHLRAVAGQSGSPVFAKRKFYGLLAGRMGKDLDVVVSRRVIDEFVSRAIPSTSKIIPFPKKLSTPSDPR